MDKWCWAGYTGPGWREVAGQGFGWNLDLLRIQLYLFLAQCDKILELCELCVYYVDTKWNKVCIVLAFVLRTQNLPNSQTFPGIVAHNFPWISFQYWLTLLTWGLSNSSNLKSKSQYWQTKGKNYFSYVWQNPLQLYTHFSLHRYHFTLIKWKIPQLMVPSKYLFQCQAMSIQLLFSSGNYTFYKCHPCTDWAPII